MYRLSFYWVLRNKTLIKRFAFLVSRCMVSRSLWSYHVRDEWITIIFSVMSSCPGQMSCLKSYKVNQFVIGFWSALNSLLSRFLSSAFCLMKNINTSKMCWRHILKNISVQPWRTGKFVRLVYGWTRAVKTGASEPNQGLPVNLPDRWMDCFISLFIFFV